MPAFKASFVASNNVLAIELDKSVSDYNPDNHSFVTNMKWTIDSDNPNSMIFENIISLDGEPTSNKAMLKKVY